MADINIDLGLIARLADDFIASCNAFSACVVEGYGTLKGDSQLLEESKRKFEAFATAQNEDVLKKVEILASSLEEKGVKVKKFESMELTSVKTEETKAQDFEVPPLGLGR